VDFPAVELLHDLRVFVLDEQPLFLVEGTDCLHVLVGQLEVEDVEVLADPLAERPGEDAPPQAA
jgi:hypothetical protein